MSLPPVDFVGMRREREAREAEEAENKIAPLPEPLVPARPWTDKPPTTGLTRIRNKAEKAGFKVPDPTYAKGWYHDGNAKVTGPHESLVLRGRLGWPQTRRLFAATWLKKSGVKEPTWEFDYAYVWNPDCWVRRVTSTELGRWLDGTD